jgi:hypothetical protein
MQVIESLAGQIKKGQELNFRTIARPDRVYKALVHVINPLVDKNGLVEINARILGSTAQLYAGMNVNVSIEQKTDPLIVIPKEALVLRSNRQVVFTYDPASGRAKWNYVTVDHENENALGISEGLKAGDLVIIEGNLNLDHDAKVQARDTKDIAEDINQ